MTPNSSALRSNHVVRAVFVAGMGFLVMMTAVVAGKTEIRDQAVTLPAAVTSGTLVLDPAVFGSSAGQASIKASPTTWSSRSNVRWTARWTEGRYLV